MAICTPVDGSRSPSVPLRYDTSRQTSAWCSIAITSERVVSITVQRNGIRETPTVSWLSTASYLPALSDPPSQIAERLILLLHYGIDWSDRNWIADYVGDYWDNLLPTRIRAATYASSSLHQWWTTVATRLGSTPRNEAQRRELATLLTTDPLPVLQVMRDQNIALTLRTRIVADAVRETRPKREDSQHCNQNDPARETPELDVAT